tara:strand:- start:433 stop:990 length:558 start_codon:yes stop_codon:yes gene_type:complete
MERINNRGTGAGGAQTNVNGLPYEIITSLDTEFTVIRNINKYTNIISFNRYNGEFVHTMQRGFKIYMIERNQINNDTEFPHGCKRPDECIIDETNRKVYILEKKFQQTSGSVCEKIQTGIFKKIAYTRLFPEYTVHYIYCLSRWLFDNISTITIEENRNNGVMMFCGDDVNYKRNIVQYIMNTRN